jgi:hypothetical protein
MKDGNVAVNLSIDKNVLAAVKRWLVDNKAPGRRNISELTQHLWEIHLRREHVLPAARAQETKDE